MNNKDYKLIDNKLLELVNNNIISNEQYTEAKHYFDNTKKESKSIVTIFSALGVFLIALSIITLFAINWNNISLEIKTIISFVPIIITGIMLYFCMKKDDSKMKLYTSIFAPISIIATNSLISQIFHIQTEIFELIFISLLMFLPIAFNLRNYISLIVYGIGAIIYTLSVMDSYTPEAISLLNIFVLSLPLIIYNVINYMENKDDRKNILMWILNVINISLILFFKEILSGNVVLIYLYMIYFITKTLFKEDNPLSKVLSSLFKIFLIISCIEPFMVSYAEHIEFGIDTLFITLLTAVFIYLSKAYKDPKEFFVFISIVLIQYTKMPEDILFIFINIITFAFSIYKIVIGAKNNSYHEIKSGISMILLLVLFRFITSDLSFMQKSILFLIAGAIFIISANVIKKRIGGKKDE